MRRSVPAILVTALAVAWAQSLWGADPAPKTQVDVRAAEQLKRMSDFLAKAKDFRVEGQSSVEVVLETGQKVQYNASSQVAVSRPYMRSVRAGPVADLLFLYDGKQFVLFDRGRNLYALSAAPGGLDQALTDARDRLDLQAPGADLLYSDVAQGLMEDVTSLQYVGIEAVDGVKTHHLAARKPGVDWQLWIQDGTTPLPRKYVITTTNLPQSPQFEVSLRNWELAPKFEKGAFSFQPPQGASRIEFLELPKAPGTSTGGSK